MVSLHAPSPHAACPTTRLSWTPCTYGSGSGRSFCSHPQVERLKEPKPVFAQRSDWETPLMTSKEKTELETAEQAATVIPPQCYHKLITFRPVGSKFEMVQPYYSAMRVHVLGYAHLSSSPPPPNSRHGIPTLECYCSQISF